MNNQEAISVLESIDAKTDYFLINDDARAEALDMAISALQAQEETVSRKVYEQISWERDIAVMQLKDLGYGLGEKIRTDGDMEWFYDGHKDQKQVTKGDVNEK